MYLTRNEVHRSSIRGKCLIFNKKFGVSRQIFDAKICKDSEFCEWL